MLKTYTIWIITHSSYKQYSFRNLVEIHIPEVSEYTLGQLIYMFEFACGVSGYMLGVNPFDQPGVEAYKKNMFALLGKPGFEELRKTLVEQ